jgi:hypothetical protein
MSAPEEREPSAFASRLAHYGDVRMRPEFRSRLRASLLTAPVVLESPRPSLFGSSRSFALRPILASVLVFALLVTAGGGVAAASSLPGDPSFALKRAAENVQAALAPDDLSRLDTLVTQSGRRLVDLETLAARRSSAVATATDEYLAASSRVESVLTRVAALAPSSGRDAALARAEAASADHLARLQALATRLPDAAQHGIQRAIEVQQTVQGKSGDAPGRGGSPVAPTNAPARPSTGPATPSGRGGPPSGVPGRP